ncbi:hypothetical protein GGR57DRAFT_493849 [Xylariaceae sp. FL1272]|nr:hypothetical protein GGR57DRAFT_493849 [Xylariaceae sp. FL1272]
MTTLRPPQYQCLRALRRTIEPLRPIIPRAACRALQSPRHRSLSTTKSTSAETPNISQTQYESPTPVFPSAQSQHPLPRRRRRGLYYAIVFLLLGTTGGTFLRLTVAPPGLPPQGSDEDQYLQSKIQAAGAALPIVQRLSADPSWTSWDAYAGVSRTPVEGRISHAETRITSGPMAGSSGLAFQRIFHNASTGEVVTVVYFGAGLAGWPGVVHGGAIATVLDESMGRCAILRFPARTGVTANLDLSYRAPTLTNNFYIIRSQPMVTDGDEVVAADGSRRSDRKLWTQARMETEKGKLCVEAKALFVVPKVIQLKPLAEGF